VILRRDQAYMAVLVDDLVTKGTSEPYRMFTSRAEYRLLLREGNADLRLTPLGRDLGLVDEARWARFTAKRARLTEVLEALEQVQVRPDAATRERLAGIQAVAPGKAVPLAQILRQPQVEIRDLAAFWEPLAAADPEVLAEAETQVRYAGYLERQAELAERQADMEGAPLSPDLDYAAVAGLTREAVEKLSRLRPLTLGQAGRISGITPAALACLDIHLRRSRA